MSLKFSRNFKNFGIFIDNGGNQNLRKIYHECLQTDIRTKNRLSPKSLYRYEGHLQSLFKQRSITFTFNSLLVERAVDYKMNQISINHPIPKQWHNSFFKNGFKLGGIRCWFFWKLDTYKRGILSASLIILQILKIMFKLKESHEIYPEIAVSITASFSNKDIFSTIPKDSFTFANWLKSIPEFFGKDLYFVSNRLDANEGNDDDLMSHFEISNLSVAKNLRADLVKEMTYVIIFGFLRSMVGKPESLSLGWELSKALIIEKVKLNQVPHYIFFSEGDGVIRPLWTYAAENRGSKVIYLFFSNCDTPTLPTEVSSYLLNYNCATWKKYWTVDEYQTLKLMGRTNLPRSNFQVTGIPWRHDPFFEFPQDLRKKVAIFSYETHIGYFGFSTINDVGYFSIEKDLKFLNDLVEVASKLDVLLLHKTKRKIPLEKRSKEYAKLLNDLASHPNYLEIPPDVSVQRIIKNSDCVISLPITSTAYIAKNLQKSSFFYDPVGKMSKNDDIYRGIQLIQSMEELLDILKNVK